MKFIGHELWIVFGDGQFDAGCIVDQVIRLFCVDLPADRLGKIDQMFKHDLQLIAVILSEAGELRGIGNLVEAAKIPKLSAGFQDGDQQLVSRDSQKLLKGQGTDKAFEMIDMLSAVKPIEG